MADPNTPTNPQAAASAALSRLPKYTFEVPESEKGLDTDPTEVVLRELTTSEILQAHQVARVREGSSELSEETMRSVMAADGKAIIWENDGKERFWMSLSSKVRDLLISGYGSIAYPTVGGRAAFLASRKTTL